MTETPTPDAWLAMLRKYCEDHPVQQETLFPWGNPNPARGECAGCKRGPVDLYRYNVIVEDAATHYTYTQLLCTPCTTDLVRTLIGQSVEPTPQPELNRLSDFDLSADWPQW